MGFSALDKVLWATGFAGHVALLLVLLLRCRWRQFPVFTGFVAYKVIETVSLFVVSTSGRPHTYFLAYWGFAFGDYIFQVLVIGEIARDVLRPTGTWIVDARRSFLLWGAAGLLVAVGIALTLTQPGLKGLDLWEMRVTVFTSMLTCELFLAMITAANRLGLQWRTQVMAIGQGLTVWCVVAIVGDLAHVSLGWTRDLPGFDLARMGVYLGALFFWTAVFWLPERQRAPLSDEMQKYLLALHARVQYDLDRINP